VETTKGSIKAISFSEKKGTQKTNIPKATLRSNLGIIGDAHAGPWHRQISLLANESIDKMVAMGANVHPGNFAENITTQGIDLLRLSIGDKLRLGECIELEITQFGKKCHKHCEIYRQVGDCVMPREGIFAKVTKGGSVNVGDTIEVIND
jgi:cyclic pyranopterin phosphate synthase